MYSIRSGRPFLGFALALLVVAAGCSKDPEQEKQAYLANGNQFVAQKKLPEAVIEYRNALRVDPAFGDARLALANTYETLEDFGNAAGEFVRAADLLPGNVQAQLKAGTYLLLSGQYQDAGTRARKALESEPKNADALILLANSMAGLKDVKGAIAEAEKALKLDPGQSQVLTTLGDLQMMSGNPADAERAFKRAIDAAPQAAAPRLALGNFYWRSQRRPEAEAMLLEALKIEPGNDVAHNALAIFYVVTGRAPEAEPHLKALAAASVKPDAKLRLADYYASQTPPRFAEADAVLGDPSLKDLPNAKLALANLRHLQANDKEAERIVDSVLATSPSNGAALVMKTRLLLDQEKYDDALARAKAAVEAQPDNADAHLVLGLAYARKRESVQAVAEFNQVLKLVPSSAVARAELAKLELEAGRPAAAQALASQAVQGLPGSLDTRLILLRSSIANRDVAQADAQARTLLQAFPKLAIVQALAGRVALMKGADADARKAFQTALTLEPELIEALAGMLTLDVKQRRPADARARVEEALFKEPESIPVLSLAASFYDSLGEGDRAEELLRKAVQVDPSNFQAYGLLANMLLKHKKLDAARAEFEKLAADKNRAVSAHTLVGIILEAQNKPDEAQKRYEQVMQLDPRAAVAANNLAWLYTERGGNLDMALQLAQVAKQEKGSDAQVDDTLGWIYYKKGLGTLAVSSFERAAASQPSNQLYLLHLGQAYALAGEKTKARETLEKALKIAPGSPQAAEIKKALGGL